MPGSLCDPTNTFKGGTTELANKYFQKCSTYLGIKEMPLQNILRFHFNLARMAKTELRQMTQMLMRMWTKVIPYSLLMRVQAGTAMIKIIVTFSKKLQINYHMT